MNSADEKVVEVVKDSSRVDPNSVDVLYNLLAETLIVKYESPENAARLEDNANLEIKISFLRIMVGLNNNLASIADSLKLIEKNTSIL